jgi:iron(III) transport system permease protein
LLILFLVYLAIAMPEASVTADAALSMVGADLAEASAVSGAGVARTFFRIYLPLMIPGLLAGWALVFVRIVGDIEASSILSGGSNNGVVGFQILAIFEQGGTSQLAALALVLTVISAVVITLVMLISWRLSKWTSTQSQRTPRTGGLPVDLP